MNLFYFRFIVITTMRILPNTVLSWLKKHCNFILKIEEIPIFGEIQEYLFLAQRQTCTL